jgi:hypothetical protein
MWNTSFSYTDTWKAIVRKMWNTSFPTWGHDKWYSKKLCSGNTSFPTCRQGFRSYILISCIIH